MKDDAQIAQLKAELEGVKKEFSQRIASLEKTITKLSSEDVEASSSAPVSAKGFSHYSAPEPIVSTEAGFPEPAERKPVKPPIDILGMLWGWLSSFQPFMAIYSPLLSTYNRYQAKGQGPIFLFIIIGITLMVFGFGYLAQLLVSELGAQSKTLALFVVAIGITGAGVKLTTLQKYEQFGSSIIGLGLVLNFTTLYVAGSFYQLMPEWLNLLGYIIIGFAGYWLSAHFNTKLVSVIALLGAGLAPFLIPLSAVTGATFIAGLGLIILAGLRHSLKQNWQWYGYLAAVVAFACVESMQQQQIAGWVIAISTETFYLLFMAFALFNVAKHEALSKPNLIMLAAVLATTSTQLFFALQNELYLSLTAIVNLAISLIVMLKAKQASRLVFTLCTAIASVWTSIAILFWLSVDYWSIGLGVEGLFLLYFAINEKLDSIRIEAQGLILVAILIAIGSVIPYFPSPALLSLKGWAICLVIGALVFLWRRIQTGSIELPHWEHKVIAQLYPAESLWLTILAMAGLWVHLDVWAAFAVPLLQLLLLYRARIAKCQATEVLVVVSAALIAFVWSEGVMESGSFRFSKLPLYSQLALLMLFAELWLLAEFYRRFMPNGKLGHLAEKMRLAFYVLLPVVALPSITRHFPEWLAFALWGAVLISYGVSTLVRRALLRLETLILAIVASVISPISFLFFVNSDYLPALSAVVTGSLLTGWFLLRQKQQHCAQLENKIASLFLYFFPASLGVLIIDLISVQIGMLVAALSGFTLSQLSAFYAVRKNRSILVNLLLINIVVCWVMASTAGSISASVYLIVSFLMFSSCFIPTLPTSLVIRRKLATMLSFLTQYNLMLMISYVLLLTQWHWDILITPTVIIHGSLLLFLNQQDKKLAKLAMLMIFVSLLKLGLIDVTVAELWQKVVLMIGIGVFMLVAAFFYQRKHTPALHEEVRSASES